MSEARLTLARLNRNRAAAKRKNRTTATAILRFDKLIEMANRRLERRQKLPVAIETDQLISSISQSRRTYKVKR